MNSIETKSLSTSENYPWKSFETIYDDLNSSMVNALQEVLLDSELRKQKCSNDIQELNQGVFYPNEYFELLEKFGQDKRNEWLKNKGSYYHGLLPVKYFQQKKESSSPTGYRPMEFTCKKDVLPSESIQAALKGLSLIGCGEVINLTRYGALNQVLGDEKFNYLFSSDSIVHFPLGQNNPILKLLKETKVTSSENLSFKKGQLIYIDSAQTNTFNVHSHSFGTTNLYAIKHLLTGEARGFNAICVDDTYSKEKFIALGTSSAGVSQETISDILLQEYNKKPLDPKKIISKAAVIKLIQINDETTLKSMKQLENDKLSKEEFKALAGGIVTQIVDWNIDRVTQLAQSSLNESVKLMNRWGKQ